MFRINNSQQCFLSFYYVQSPWHGMQEYSSGTIVFKMASLQGKHEQVLRQKWKVPALVEWQWWHKLMAFSRHVAKLFERAQALLSGNLGFAPTGPPLPGGDPGPETHSLESQIFPIV